MSCIRPTVGPTDNIAEHDTESLACMLTDAAKISDGTEYLKSETVSGREMYRGTTPYRFRALRGSFTGVNLVKGLGN